MTKDVACTKKVRNKKRASLGHLRIVDCSSSHHLGTRVIIVNVLSVTFTTAIMSNLTEENDQEIENSVPKKTKQQRTHLPGRDDDATL